MRLIRNKSGEIRWSAIFYVWLIHGVIAFWQFINSPAFETSFPYLLICGVLILWIAAIFILIMVDLKRVFFWGVWKETLDQPKIRDAFLAISSLFVFVRISLWYLRGLFGQELALQIGGYLDILAPLLNLMAYVSIESAFLIAAANMDRDFWNKISSRKFFILFFIILSVLGLLTLLVSKTGLGILPSYKGDWQRGLPAVPLLEWQIILAGLLCVGMLFFETKRKTSSFPYLDILICVVIWAGASIFWLSQPVIPNPSVLTPHEPNFELYPFIDSQTYDELAQSALVGNGFGENHIPQRPLYLVFLTLLHVLVGQDYGKMVVAQSLFFAFFPVLLYLLGKELFGRPVGVSVALLAILRDHTSNLVSPFTGNLSYSKVLLSEIPTAMMLVLFLWIGVKWIKSNFSIYYGFLLGGILGSAMLIRTQVIVSVPLIILIALLSKPASFKPLIKSILLMLISMVIVVSPWLWRNWNITGDLIFDNPESQTMNLALRYSRVNGIDYQVARLPNETSSEFGDRLQQIAKDAILSNPSGAAWALTNSFINHGVNNILLFPLRNEIRNFDELLIPSDAFWEKWEGRPTTSQWILLISFIFIFGLGVSVAGHRNGWLGLMPLGLNLIYNLWTSLALLSGQRFMLAMDWSIYLYYMIGFFALAGFFLCLLNSGRSTIVDWVQANPFSAAAPVMEIKLQRFIFPAILFLGIGLSLPLAENIFPDRYPPLSQGKLLAELSASPALEQSPADAACFQKLANANQIKVVQGRALYPRYYSAGDGEDFTDTPGYKAMDQGRLVFDIVGQASQRIIFPMPYPPDFFPHISDVTLVYSRSGELWFIFVKQERQERFYASSTFDPSYCLTK